MKLDYLLSHSLINSYKFTAKDKREIKGSNRNNKSKRNRKNQTNITPQSQFAVRNDFD